MRCVVVAFLCILAAGCQTGASPSWQGPVVAGQADALAGLRAADALESCHGGGVRDSQAETRMERIANRIAAAIPGPPISCRCRLLASEGINAYSLPGGLIYITQGLYDRLGSDNCLAAVLAHELAHVVAKDSMKPWRVPPCTKLFREMSADCRGVRYLAQAGYPTSSMIDLLHLIRPVLSEEWAEARIQAVALQEKASAPGPALASADQAAALR